MFDIRPGIADFAQENPREGTIFSLLPRTAAADEVLHRNRWLVSKIVDFHGKSTYGLNIGAYLRPQSSAELVSFGRGRSADVTIEGEDVSRVHFTFDLVRNTGAIMLRDHSTWQTTQTFETFGGDVHEMERGRIPRWVMVSRDTNLTIGFGNQHRFKFQLIWHQTQRTHLPVNCSVDDPTLARTIGDAPVATVRPTRAPTVISTPAVVTGSAPVRWVQKGMLGSGSFGKVYSAWNVDSGELYAVKVVTVRNQHERAILQREVSTLARVTHKNIVEYRGDQFGPTTCHPPTYEIFTELKDGNASDLFGTNSMDHGVALHMFHDMLQALDYLDALNIMHRDVKPENILFKCDRLDSQMRPTSYIFQLADFGIAKIVNHTETHTGSPLYMAPEINPDTNSKHYPQTPAADIWSLLVTIIFALNKDGIREHSMKSHAEVIARVQKVAAQHLPDLHRMVHSDPTRRPSAGMLLDEHFQGKGKFPRERKINLVEENDLDSRCREDNFPSKPRDPAKGIRLNGRFGRSPAQRTAAKVSAHQRQRPVDRIYGGVRRSFRARNVVKYTS